MIVCGTCGESVADAMLYCTACGERLVPREASVVRAEPTTPKKVETDAPPRNRHLIGLVAGAVLFTGLAAFIGFIDFLSTSGSDNANSNDATLHDVNAEAAPLQSQTILDDSKLLVEAKSYMWQEFTLTDAGRVLGGYDGNGNSIECLLMSATDFHSWTAGRASNAFYQSGAFVVAGRLDVTLDAGRYVLVFRNEDAMDKLVSANAVLQRD